MPRRAAARISHRARPGHSLRRRRGAELCREHAGARTGAGDEPDDPNTR
ncbi:MAG TPA: hypothetical protein VFU65_15110 [Actinocrinis sp.]|nr:hypothetical protein [Actinocrinis sp.]HEU5427859.1 hypothetical protein [Actinocrinis sp.]